MALVDSSYMTHVHTNDEHSIIENNSYCSLNSFKNSRLYSKNFTKSQQEWFTILQIAKDNQINAVNLIKLNIPSNVYENTPPLLSVPCHNDGDVTLLASLKHRQEYITEGISCLNDDRSGHQHPNSIYIQCHAAQPKEADDSSLSVCSNSNASNDIITTFDSAATTLSSSSMVNEHCNRLFLY